MATGYVGVLTALTPFFSSTVHPFKKSKILSTLIEFEFNILDRIFKKYDLLRTVSNISCKLHGYAGIQHCSGYAQLNQC